MTFGTKLGGWVANLLSVLGAWLLITAFVPTNAQAQIPPDIVPFIDLKCYGITGPDGGPLPPLNVPLRLDHLNPLFGQLNPPLPPETVTVLDPFQLCVPIAKNGVFPPPAVQRFIEFIDLKCYNIVDAATGLPGDPLNLQLVLNHLNPVLQRLGAPPELVTLFEPQKLCVPVAKNNRIPPPDVLPFVSFIDQKCYNIAGDPLNTDLRLDHLNPLLREILPPPSTESVRVADAQQLCVPVQKNQVPPPTPFADTISKIDLKCYAITNVDGFPLPPLGVPLLLSHLNPVFPPPGVARDEQVVVQEPQQLCVPVDKLLPPPPLGKLLHRSGVPAPGFAAGISLLH